MAMLINPRAPFWSNGSIRPSLRKSVRFESLKDSQNYLRKLGFTGIAIDDVDDRRWLVHACSLWLQLFKNKDGEWSSSVIFCC